VAEVVPYREFPEQLFWTHVGLVVLLGKVSSFTSTKYRALSIFSISRRFFLAEVPLLIWMEFL
jgi:hypothetical protein